MAHQTFTAKHLLVYNEETKQIIVNDNNHIASTKVYTNHKCFEATTQQEIDDKITLLGLIAKK